MQTRYYNPTETGVNAKATTGAGNAIYVRGARFHTVSLATASSANMTVKFYGAIGDSAPDFGSASAVGNEHAPLDFAFTNNSGTITDGDTGVVWSGTDATHMVEINADNVDWICIVITARAAGTLTAKASIAFPA